MFVQRGHRVSAKMTSKFISEERKNRDAKQAIERKREKKEERKKEKNKETLAERGQGERTEIGK
jgi:hypothetical protein